MQLGKLSIILQFIRSVVRHWGSLVSGGAIIGFLGMWQGTGHRVPPTVYWIIAIVAIFVACFRAWNEERIAKEKALTEIAELKLAKAAAARDGLSLSAEWKELANKFEKVGLDASAQWQCNRRNNQTIFENWNFSGTYQKPCETLCRFAGTLLAKSPNVSRTVSQFALQQTEPAWRWLFFLKENHNALDYGSGDPGIGDDGTIYFGGRISNVAAVSARAVWNALLWNFRIVVTPELPQLQRTNSKARRPDQIRAPAQTIARVLPSSGTTVLNLPSMSR